VRHPRTWLCLLVVLACPLLCQAKLAYGLELSLAEIGRNVLESAQEEAEEDYDGCELVAVGANAPLGIDTLAVFPAAFDFLLPIPSFNLPPSTLNAVRHRHGQWHWPPPTARKRHAMLQTYLF
jgi:hypothetical protein